MEYIVTRYEARVHDAATLRTLYESDARTFAANVTRQHPGAVVDIFAIHPDGVEEHLDTVTAG